MSRTIVDPSDLSHSYLVLVTEALVAKDLALTISDYDPAARVIVALTAADAEAAISAVPSLSVAFVAGRPSSFKGSGLERAIAARGARVILMGIEAESVGPTADFDVLTQPFDTDAVIARLQAQ